MTENEGHQVAGEAAGEGEAHGKVSTIEFLIKIRKAFRDAVFFVASTCQGGLLDWEETRMIN